MEEGLVEHVAAAIEKVQLFSRFNDWTTDRVPGLPIEICRYGNDDEEEIVVVQRFAGDDSDSTLRQVVRRQSALRQVVRRQRAMAAIKAIKDWKDAVG